MCGLAGLVRREGPIEGDPHTLALAFGAALAHRGPDGEGAWTSTGRDVLLVHRRLAIIDPGPAAAQPMVTPDGVHRLVFNGEIYNYRELRHDLEVRGERFVTASDTEVLLRLVALDGPQALARVRGMFALACWDARERSVLLARDRFGIKPLYVVARRDTLAFASEIRALRAVGYADAPSPAGVLAFLNWGSVPAPLTWQSGVEALPAGTWWIWRQDGRDSRGRFADVSDLYRSDGWAPADGFRASVGAAVRDSVRAHLVADVPIGVFLSGGIDSAAIVSAALSAGVSALATFTVGFDDPTSEAERARSVAERFGTQHHQLTVDASAIVREFPSIVTQLDQPSIDGFNSFYVSKAVAATGIKTVLSGIGGDELFGGYPSFTRLPRAIAVRRAMGPVWPALSPMVGWFVPPRLRARWQFFAGGDGRLEDAYRVQRGFLMPSEIDALAGPALREPSVWRAARERLQQAERAWLEPTGEERTTAAVARLETRLYLGSQLLRDVDAMAMAHGLEVRVPFVDHELVGAVWPRLGLQPSLLSGKRLLHETLERPLPREVVRHPKQGFTLPFSRWIGGELAPPVREGMSALAKAGWVAPDVPERVWRDWATGVAHWSRPWGLAVLGWSLAAQGQSTACVPR